VCGRRSAGPSCSSLSWSLLLQATLPCTGCAASLPPRTLRSWRARWQCCSTCWAPPLPTAAPRQRWTTPQPCWQQLAATR
jgi:hypothetical protein